MPGRGSPGETQGGGGSRLLQHTNAPSATSPVGPHVAPLTLSQLERAHRELETLQHGATAAEAAAEALREALASSQARHAEEVWRCACCAGAGLTAG
jgi:hypothetical protein